MRDLGREHSVAEGDDKDAPRLEDSAHLGEDALRILSVCVYVRAR
jgi:hypothetical protein